MHVVLKYFVIKFSLTVRHSILKPLIFASLWSLAYRSKILRVNIYVGTILSLIQERSCVHRLRAGYTMYYSRANIRCNSQSSERNSVSLSIPSFVQMKFHVLGQTHRLAHILYCTPLIIEDQEI